MIEAILLELKTRLDIYSKIMLLDCDWWA